MSRYGLFWALGFASRSFGLDSGTAPAVVVTAGALLSSMGKGRAWLTRGLLMAAVFLAGGLFGLPESAAPGVDSGLYAVEFRAEGGRHALTGVTTEVVLLAGHSMSGGERPPSGLRIRLEGSFARGQRSRAVLRLRPAFTHPAERGAFSWPWSSALRWRATVLGPIMVLQEPGGWDSFWQELRLKTRRHLRRNLSLRASTFARAVLLGESDSLSREDRSAVRGVGLAHILAISGLHVGLVTLSLLRLLQWSFKWTSSCLSSRAQLSLPYLLSLPAPWCVASLGGMAPSAERAALMLSAALLIGASGRRPSARRVYFGALAAFSVGAPESLVSYGGTLSFIATWSLLPLAERRVRRGRAWIYAASAPTLVTAPLVWWWFGRLSPWALLTNAVLAAPFCALLVGLSWAYITLGWLGSGVAGAIGMALDWTCIGLVGACESLIRWVAPLELVPPTPRAWLGGAILAALPHLRLSRVAFLALAGLAALMVLGASAEGPGPTRRAPHLRLETVSVGQADCHIMRTPLGKVVVVDVGATDSSLRQAVRPALRRAGARAIDLLILTHAHPDHWRGTLSLLGMVPIREVWVNAPIAGSGPYPTMLRTLQSAGVRVRGPGEICGPVHTVGGLDVQVISPCHQGMRRFSENSRSLVTRFSYFGRHYLFAGDIEVEAEKYLLDVGALSQVDVLKVAHHGSRTSTSSLWLEALRPRWVIISAGRANPFGHPHEEVLRRLGAFGATVFRTDVHGHITLVQRGAGIYGEFAGTSPASSTDSAE